MTPAQKRAEELCAMLGAKHCTDIAELVLATPPEYLKPCAWGPHSRHNARALCRHILEISKMNVRPYQERVAEALQYKTRHEGMRLLLDLVQAQHDQIARQERLLEKARTLARVRRDHEETRPICEDLLSLLNNHGANPVLLIERRLGIPHVRG